MARQRRGGFRPPQLRGTLGTLLRTTLAQAGGLRDVLERGAREGRARLDDALSGRRRNEALADLGEIVLDLVRRGEIEIDQLPEAADLVAHLDELDAEHPPEDDRTHKPGNRDIAVAPSRSRFDAREEGTVTSSKWVAPARAAATAATAAAARVWRPPATEAPPAPMDRPAPKKLGGISFAKDDDDSDLADYMHPDDVPSKTK